MSRPKLSPLSSLLPAKGAATRPEAVSSPASEQKDMQESLQASERESEQATKQSTSLGRSRPETEDDDYKTGSRSAVSFRMTEQLQDRLRDFAHVSRRKKQDVLDQAVHEFLKREGY